MPMLQLTEVYKVENSSVEGKNQTVSLQAKYGDQHKTKIKGIPADVDLREGNIEMQTFHVAGEMDKNNAKEEEPFKIEIYKRLPNGEMDLDGSTILLRNEDGTYRHKTKAEIQRTNQTNMQIIADVLSHTK